MHTVIKFQFDREEKQHVLRVNSRTQMSSILSPIDDIRVRNIYVQVST